MRQRKLLAGLFLLIVCMIPMRARAQVNAETLRAQLKKTPNFLQLDGSIDSRTGNAPGFSLSAGAFGGVTRPPHLFFAKASADYGTTTDQQLIVAKSLLHVRYNYETTKFLYLELLAQVQHDHFRRIAVRDLYGTGLRFNWIRLKDFEVYHGNTILLEQQSIAALDPYPSESAVDARSSNYLGVNANLWDVGTLTTVTYIQPRLGRLADYRILSESNIEFGVTKHLSAIFSASFTYDSVPPGGVLPLDVELKNSLAVKFQ